MSADATGRAPQDDELVAFFRSLPPADRREYEALAELDRRFGEDVVAEHARDSKRRTGEPT